MCLNVFELQVMYNIICDKKKQRDFTDFHTKSGLRHLCFKTIVWYTILICPPPPECLYNQPIFNIWYFAALLHIPINLMQQKIASKYIWDSKRARRAWSIKWLFGICITKILRIYVQYNYPRAYKPAEWLTIIRVRLSDNLLAKWKTFGWCLGAGSRSNVSTNQWQFYNECVCVCSLCFALLFFFTFLFAAFVKIHRSFICRPLIQSTIYNNWFNALHLCIVMHLITAAKWHSLLLYVPDIYFCTHFH